MPTYDFLCPDCDRKLSNEFLTFEEFDAMKAMGGFPCPDCPGLMHTVPTRVSFKFAKVHGRGSQMLPGSKRERRQMLEQRYDKRNERLEALPPHQKAKMLRFMDKYGVRKTSPADL